VTVATTSMAAFQRDGSRAASSKACAIKPKSHIATRNAHTHVTAQD
jgi:hypothetical protein